MAIIGNPSIEPRGFGEHARGRASQHAHQQGWGLQQESRTRPPQGKQNTDGGTDYDYGARDFGDEPIDTSSATSGDKVEQARIALEKE